MRIYTDLYQKAKQESALPVILAYIESDNGWRCFGKENPIESHLIPDKNVVEWGARVISFGAYRRSLSQDNGNVYLSLTTQEMSTASIQLDNTDGYFNEILRNEIFLTKRLEIYQGWFYPGITYLDYKRIFSGKISDIQLDRTISIKADTNIEPEPPEDPAIDTTVLYSIETNGVTEIAAQTIETYTTTYETIYSKDETIADFEIIKDSTGNDETLLRITNQKYGNNRIKFGIDENNRPYLEVSPDIDTPAPLTSRSTANFEIGTSVVTRVSYKIDSDGAVIISDNKGNEYIEYPEQIITRKINIATPERGSGIAIDNDDNIFITNTFSSKVAKYNSTGIFQANYTGSGQLYRPAYAYIYNNESLFVSDIINDLVYRISLLDDSVLTSFPVQNNNAPYGLYVNSSNELLVCNSQNNEIDRFTLNGTYLGSFGSAHLNFPSALYIREDDHIFVTNFEFVVHFDNNRQYVSTIGSSGDGDGQFRNPNGITVAPDGSIFVSSNGTFNEKIHQFDSNEEFVRTIGEGDFAGTGGIVNSGDAGDYIICIGNPGIPAQGVNRYNLFEKNFDYDKSDTFPTTTDDEIVLCEDFDGKTVYSYLADDILWKNDGGDTETVVKDLISNIDLTIVDGVWTEYGQINKYTEEVKTVETVTLERKFIPATTELYTNSSEQNIYLPLIYGDMTENSTGGVWVAPEIDTINHVYCVSGWPVLSISNGNAINIYVDGEEVTTGFTFSHSNNYEGQGEIAILDFDSDPGGKITVSCKGKDDGSGNLITNPLEIVDDFIKYVSVKWDLGDFRVDGSSFNAAYEESIKRGYICAGIINQSNTLTYWIKNILSSFLMTYEYDSDGKLAIRYINSENIPLVQEIIEQRDRISCQFKRNINNLCNRLLINYAIAYEEIDRRYKGGGQKNFYKTYDSSGEQVTKESLRKYGENLWELDFEWSRNDSTILTISSILLNQFNRPKWLLNYSGTDFKHIALDLFDQIEVNFYDTVIPFGTIFELRGLNVNLDNFTVELELLETDFKPFDTIKKRVYIDSRPVFINNLPVYIETRTI